MDEVPGSLGTRASVALRLGQTFSSITSLLFMSLGVPFYSYPSFCFLVTIMALVIPWSFTFALVDGHLIVHKCPVRQSGIGILLVIVIGDWVLSILTLAGACSTVSVVDLLLKTEMPYCLEKVCSRYQVSATMAFLT